jgi:hypothetical protein
VDVDARRASSTVAMKVKAWRLERRRGRPSRPSRGAGSTCLGGLVDSVIGILTDTVPQLLAMLHSLGILPG